MINLKKLHMKTRITFVILLLGLTQVSYSQSGEEAKVADAVEKLRVAMVDGDAEKLGALTSDILSYGHSSGTIEDKATYVLSITSGKNDFKSIEQTNQTIKLKGNIAIVRHTFKAEVLINGNSAFPNIGILQVWQNENGNWKLIARQAYKI